MFEESRNVHREANSRVGQTMNDPGIFENQSLEFWPPQIVLVVIYGSGAQLFSS